MARVVLLSGMVDPLPLFPEWAQVALRSLPFAGLVDLPFRIYTGHIAIGGLGPVFLIVCLQVCRSACATTARPVVEPAACDAPMTAGTALCG